MKEEERGGRKETGLEAADNEGCALKRRGGDGEERQEDVE